MPDLSSEDLGRMLDTTCLRQWGEDILLRVKGPECLDLLHRLSTSALVGRKEGETVGTCFLTDKGRLVEYAQVLIRNDEALLVVSAGNSERVAAWIDRFIIMEEVSVLRCDGHLTGFSVVGPRAGDAIKDTLGCLPDPWHHCQIMTNDGEIIVSRRGSLEADQFDVIVPFGGNNLVGTLQSLFPEDDPSFAEFLRIWKGVPAFPGEISEDFNPYEAGLSAFLDGQKGCYIGQEIVARLETYDKVQRAMSGVLLSGKPAGRSDLTVDGTSVGKITSIAPFSIRGWYPGLTIIRKSLVQTGLPVVTRESVRGFLSPLPFSMDALFAAVPDLSRRHHPGVGK